VLKIEVLYPELCNLFGDAMNAEYLHRVLPEAEIIKTSLKSRPAFADDEIDFVYLGSMTEKAQELATNALFEFRERVFKMINDGKIFLVTGNALELFGKRIENEDGSAVETLGLFDLYAKRQMMRRYSSIYLGTFEEMKIVGFKSQFAHNYGDGGEVPALFETERGAGRKPGQKEEGVRINNFLGTSILGPLLILNPPFTHYILDLLGAKKRELPYEKEATIAYNARVKEFSDPNTGAEY
jgi:CobQ-like glutamine amidotransferase family enzyme